MTTEDGFGLGSKEDAKMSGLTQNVIATAAIVKEVVELERILDRPYIGVAIFR